MNLRAALLVTALVMVSCGPNGFPDPYEGFQHTEPGHGYWCEITSGDARIKELHLHSTGFSVTYLPFETYKDYWGDYHVTENGNRIRLLVDGGNDLPEFEEVAGDFSRTDPNRIQISGIALDRRRPARKQFRFERFGPRTTGPGGPSTAGDWARSATAEGG